MLQGIQLMQCFSNCGPQAVSKKNWNIVITLNSWKIHVCAEATFVSWLSTEMERISSFHNFLFFYHYFRKYLKLVYRKKCGYGNFNHRYNVSPIYLHAHFGCGKFYECAPRMRWPPMKWSAIAKCLRNIAPHNKNLDSLKLSSAIHVLSSSSEDCRLYCGFTSPKIKFLHMSLSLVSSSVSPWLVMLRLAPSINPYLGLPSFAFPLVAILNFYHDSASSPSLYMSKTS
jgi:hypothetical protein